MQGTVAGEALLVDYPALLEPVGYPIVASAGMIRQLFTRVDLRWRLGQDAARGHLAFGAGTWQTEPAWSSAYFRNCSRQVGSSR